MRPGLAWWLVLATVATPLEAQHRRPVAIDLSSPASEPCSDGRVCELLGAAGAQVPVSRSAWAIAASAIVPGSGQAILGVDRALPYLAIEAFAWTAFVDASQEYRRRRNGYRELASRVARAPFGAFRPNGDFEYYERMTHFLQSGRYEVVGGGTLDPETDTTTYNGAMWLLARRTYWSNPEVAPDTTSAEWKRAISFYRGRAYDHLYRWSWTNAPLEYAMFLDLIRDGNDANRRAMQHLGVIIANHFLSTVDAFITVRLRGQGQFRTFGVEGSLPLQSLHRRKKAVNRSH